MRATGESVLRQLSAARSAHRYQPIRARAGAIAATSAAHGIVPDGLPAGEHGSDERPLAHGALLAIELLLGVEGTGVHRRLRGVQCTVSSGPRPGFRSSRAVSARAHLAHECDESPPYLLAVTGSPYVTPCRVRRRNPHTGNGLVGSR